MTMIVARVFAEPFDGSNYVTAEYDVTTAINTFKVRKEHYAQGASLYAWLVYDAQGNVVAERATRKAALEWIEANG